MRFAFKMKLFAGFSEEYKKRHDAIWPELQQMLRRHGIKKYSIFFDEETNLLFAYLTVDDMAEMEKLPTEEIMRKWWEYMKDIMETNENGSPVSIPLKEVFYLE